MDTITVFVDTRGVVHRRSKMDDLAGALFCTADYERWPCSRLVRSDEEADPNASNREMCERFGGHSDDGSGTCVGCGSAIPEPILECESCGRIVRKGEDIGSTYTPGGCDHWYQEPQS